MMDPRFNNWTVTPYTFNFGVGQVQLLYSNPRRFMCTIRATATGLIDYWVRRFTNEPQVPGELVPLPYTLLYGTSGNNAATFSYMQYGQLIQDEIWANCVFGAANVQVTEYCIAQPFSSEFGLANECHPTYYRTNRFVFNALNQFPKVLQANPNRVAMIAYRFGSGATRLRAVANDVTRTFEANNSRTPQIVLTYGNFGPLIQQDIFLDPVTFTGSFQIVEILKA